MEYIILIVPVKKTKSDSRTQPTRWRLTKMSYECDELHLDDASMSQLINEINFGYKELTDDHITVLKEIIAEYER